MLVSTIWATSPFGCDVCLFQMQEKVEVKLWAGMCKKIKDKKKTLCREAQKIMILSKLLQLLKLLNWKQIKNLMLSLIKKANKII